MNTTRLLVSPPDRWADLAAESILRYLPFPEDLRHKRRLALALAGGSTPSAVYESLTQQILGASLWKDVDLYLSDERMVPLDDPESNYRMARDTLVHRLGEPQPQLFPVDTSQPAELAAQAYEKLIRQRVTAPEGLPSFDMILLGVGEDGHTASLFPGTDILEDDKRLVASAEHPETRQPRITFTLSLLAAANIVVFLVRGAAKANIVRAIIEDEHASDLPAARAADVAANVLWLLDEEAASKLSDR
jgi:6-phosphogluconolactonase